MGLEVRFNKTEHLHENAQFDRVALHLVPFFEEQEWDGLLIGNPVSEDYPRFRADAILLYTNGLIIVDFKDYQGEIVMPLNDEDFRTDTWFNNTEDGNRIKIEAGNNHTNPYKQLDRYRGVMKGIVQDDSLLRYVMNTKMICALNVFSGPITLNRYTSRKVPYYQLKSELDLHNFLNQYASPNKFEEAIGNIFKTLFPAQEWKGDLSIDPNTYYKKQTVNHKQIDKDLVPALEEFYGSNESGILVLESMEQGLRDEWMKMANTFALENDSDTDIWCHSSRIARKINLRTYFDVHSLYSIIYGGKVSDNNEKIEEELDKEPDLNQQVIGVKSDSDIDENATIIVPEAHLVSRSLHQTDLMKFGTGRLLEDLIQFLRLDKTKRKIIFIGDPYMLSYGKVEDCALNIDTLNDLFENSNIIRFRHSPEKQEEDTDLLKIRKTIGSSINQKYFNRLNYNYDTSLQFAEHNDGLNCIKDWFLIPQENEPRKSVLFFSKKDARTTNLWIKNNLLNNGKSLAKDDLLILNNNINIPDDTGLSIPTKAVNGSYFLVKEIMEQIPETITNKKKEFVAQLLFRRIKIKLLGNSRATNAEIIILENYFYGIEELSREEQVAFKIFINKKLAETKKSFPFENSQEYQNLQSDTTFKEALTKITEWQKEDKEGQKVYKKDLKIYEVERNKIERNYKKQYNNNLLIHLRNKDPFVNAALINYGWAITVHKSVGSNFDSVLFKTVQQEDGGVSNESYFRWLYSGFTAANSKVFILNPKSISPFDNCTIVNEVAIDTDLKFSTVNPNLSFEQEEIPNSIKAFNSEDLNYNSLMVIKYLLEQLDGYTIENIKKSSNYLIKATIISKDELETLIAINNKGNLEVSSIRLERSAENDYQHIEKVIKKLYSKAKEDNYPTDFRKEIYRDWEESFKKKKCKLYLQDSHQNEDRFSVTMDDQVVNFNLRYTIGERNYGFFSSLTIKEKSNEDIVEIIKGLVKND